MPDISKIQLPGTGTVYDIKDAVARQRLPEYIKGTQNIITARWTGATADAALYDGKQIAYFLPYASTGSVSLELTLADGVHTTGTKDVFLYNNTIVNCDYPASTVLRLVWASDKNAWFIESSEIPKINNVSITGSVTLAQLGLRAVYYDTTANWSARLALVSEAGAAYIYSDHEVYYDSNSNPVVVPGVKIGDGTSFVTSLPFTSDALAAALASHIGDATMHVTAAEKQAWNNKVSSYIDESNPENLVLSKTFFMLNGTLTGS